MGQDSDSDDEEEDAALDDEDVCENSCRWPCSMTIAPDQCATCNAPVHRLCQSLGKMSKGWSHHGEIALCCPTCHPDREEVQVNKDCVEVRAMESNNDYGVTATIAATVVDEGDTKWLVVNPHLMD